MIMESSSSSDFSQILNQSKSTFIKHFKTAPTICSYAPGRVNLIGEHTDYNDGFVLPMALPMVTLMVGKPNDTSSCHIITTCPFVDNPTEVQFLLPSNEDGEVLKPEKPTWANYIKGVIMNYTGELVGFDAVISTTVPVGGGLSSSAALEVATYCFLEALSNKTSSIGLVDKALACQKAEHEFLGMPCGIMDQFISFMGKSDHALLLDCRSLNYELIKLADPNVTVLITNTNVRHKLAESQYSNRKKQCEAACKVIGKSSLRDVSLIDLENHSEILGAEIHRRALHVVSEIKRTADAANELKEGNYARFGSLMTESHISLRDNYEVSCPELDIVVNSALEVEGVYGSRMTGGGFGGCTVALLKTDAIKKTTQNIKAKYENATFYECRPGDGAKVLQL